MKFYDSQNKHIKTIPKKFETLLKSKVENCLKDFTKKRLSKTERALLEIELYKSSQERKIKELIEDLKLIGAVLVESKWGGNKVVYSLVTSN